MTSLERARSPIYSKKTGALAVTFGVGRPDNPRRRQSRRSYWIVLALDGVAVSLIPLRVVADCHTVFVVFDPK